jgi:hypothetical protein
MKDAMEKRTGNDFKVKASDGQVFNVVEFVQLIDVGDYDNPNDTIEGLKRYQTSSGLHVNRFGESEFEVLGAGPLADPIKARRV